MKYYNNLAPFPVYDTDYVNDVENKIKEIMNDKLKEYDEEPVWACRFCKKLHIESDEVGNDVCMICGSINELQEYKTIFEWQKNKNND
jgi:rubrerythrin